MMLPRRGLAIWSRTTPSMIVSPNPFWRAFSKAASRFGPWFPLVPACCRVWQLPHVALPMKSFLPLTRSGELRPQPASATAARATTAAAHRDVLWRLRPKARRRLSARAARRLVSRRTWKLVEAALRGGDHTACDARPAEPPPGLVGQRGARSLALLGRRREPLGEPLGDLGDRAGRAFEREQRADLLVDRLPEPPRDLGEARMCRGERQRATCGRLDAHHPERLRERARLLLGEERKKDGRQVSLHE